MSWTNSSSMQGMVFLSEGDVIALDNEKGIPSHICDYSNDSRARIIPLKMEVRTIVPETGRDAGQTRTITDRKDAINISNTIPAYRVVQRVGKDGIKDFLAAEASRRKERWKDAQNQIKESQGDDMSDKNGKKPARGGLAASAAGAKAPKAAKAPRSTKPKGEKKDDGSKGALGALMGFSVVSVIRALAKKGDCSPARTEAILKKAMKGATPPKLSTIKIQTSAARTGKADPAPLSKEQLDELLGLADEPKTKEEKTEAKAA